MTIEQDELRAPGMNEVDAWLGEPIRLHREWGDRLFDNWLPTDVVIPGDAPPAVRAAAEQAQAAQAERDKWVHARDVARPAGREPLARKVAQLIGTDGPELVKVRRELTDFDTDSNIIASELIPQADQAIVNAWYELSAALRVSWGEKDTSIYAKVPALVATALRFAEGYQRTVSELQRLDDLHAGIGIVSRTPETPAEIDAQFKREERRQSVRQILGGEDRGQQGRIFGLADVVHDYGEALTPPPPPEPEPEPVERAVQLQRRRKGLHPLTGEPVDPFMISD